MKKEEEKIIFPIPTDAEAQEKFKRMAKHLDAWQKNDRPKWKAVKETRELIDKFLKQPANNTTISYDDILKSFENTGNTTRSKMNKNNRIPEGSVIVVNGRRISPNTQKKYLDALKMYEKLKADISPPSAKSKVTRRNGWRSIQVTEKNLTIARKIRKNQNLPQK